VRGIKSARKRGKIILCRACAICFQFVRCTEHSHLMFAFPASRCASASSHFHLAKTSTREWDFPGPRGKWLHRKETVKIRHETHAFEVCKRTLWGISHRKCTGCKSNFSSSVSSRVLRENLPRKPLESTHLKLLCE